MTGRIRSIKVALALFIIAACMLSIVPSVQAAQTPQFRIDIDSLKLQKGVSTNLTLAIVDAKGAEVTEVSGLDNFDILSSNQSSARQIANGVETYEQDFNYSIMPKKTGSFTLQGSIKYNSKTYQTNVLQINVSEAKQAENAGAEDIYVKTLLSDQEVYFGQKVVLSYELYTRYNIENFGFLEDTSLNGFISNDIPRDQLKSEIIELDGKKYARHEAKQSILSPIKTGTYTIPAYKFQVNVSSGSFFDSSKPVYLETESKQLTVKPLPLANQPADFSGIVGNLSLKSKYSTNTIKYGESVTLQVTASGNGNLDSLKDIVKDDLPGFSVFQTEKNKQEGIVDNQYISTKEFEIILVPKVNGDIKIDPIHISYFNPETGHYEQAEIPGTTITVKGEVPQAQAAANNNSNNDTAAVETVSISQVNYNSQNDDTMTIHLKKDQLYIGLGLLVLLMVITASVVWFFSYRKKSDKTLQVLYKELMHSNDPTEIYNQFNSMIKHVYTISIKANTRNIIANRLDDNELTDHVMEIMDYMEQGKYRSDQANNYLKTKMKLIYKLLTNQRRRANENQAIRFRAQSDGSAVERG